MKSDILYKAQCSLREFKAYCTEQKDHKRL